MKKINSILSIFILSFVFFSCQKANIEPSFGSSEASRLKALPAKPLEMADTNNMGNAKTRYEVVVHLANTLPICNTYLIELKDETGRAIGPAQKFDPEISTYDFFEMVSNSGTRIARLVTDPAFDYIICSTDLFTLPAIIHGPFIGGGSYTFNLYPQATAQKIID